MQDDHDETKGEHETGEDLGDTGVGGCQAWRTTGGDEGECPTQGEEHTTEEGLEKGDVKWSVVLCGRI